MKLTLLAARLAVCRLEPGAETTVPDHAAFFALTRTAAETSIVCDEADAPPTARCEPGWRALMVAGPLDFNLTGILAGIAQPLAAAGVSIFAVSTFDTDYVLVREAQLELALSALTAAGYEVQA